MTTLQLLRMVEELVCFGLLVFSSLLKLAELLPYMLKPWPTTVLLGLWAPSYHRVGLGNRGTSTDMLMLILPVLPWERSLPLTQMYLVFCHHLWINLTGKQGKQDSSVQYYIRDSNCIISIYKCIWAHIHTITSIFSKNIYNIPRAMYDLIFCKKLSQYNKSYLQRPYVCLQLL